MAVDNEELMMELQRVAVLMRRSRRAKMKNRPEDKEGKTREGGRGCGCHRGGTAFGNPESTHGYGNHKCNGGSGRHGQNRILSVLVMQDGTSQKDLAYLLGIRPQSLTQALETLEQEGFIERKQDADDKRSRLVFLTEKGRSRAGKVAEDRKQYADDAFSMLDENEKAQLSAILEKIGSSLDEELPTHPER